MSIAPQPLHPRGGRGLFLSQMLRRPGRLGAVAPSSHALARMMVAGLGPETGAVVELGSGTGKITEAILARGVPQDRLSLVETNPAFASLLRRRFPAAQVLEFDARRIGETALRDVGAVVSGLPLLLIPTPAQRAIVEGAFHVMRPGGMFVQFTYGWRPPVDRAVREALGLQWDVSPWVIGNLPPARVYTFRQGPR